MYPFRRLLVGLDLSGRESSTLKYAAMAARMTGPSRVHFCHVASRSDILDEEILKKHPELKDALGDEILVQEMRELVDADFDCPEDVEVFYDVIYDSPLQGLVRHAIKKDIDLIIVGSKGTNRVLPEKLARNAVCSILIVPEGSKAEFSKILVPLDFSHLSSDAMKVALSAYREGAELLCCMHAYRIPYGYHKLGKSRESFAEIMSNHAQREYDEFMAQFDCEDVNLKTEFPHDHNVANAIVQAIEDNDINLVVIGARGRSGTAVSFLLGSVTEKLIRRSSVPILAIKKKGANLSLLQALFHL
jgi:nucleotide-binding universal stress UspA family protein